MLSSYPAEVAYIGRLATSMDLVFQHVTRNATGFAEGLLDRRNPAYDIALSKARPWRRLAREGSIYRERLSDDPRSRRRDEF